MILSPILLYAFFIINKRKIKTGDQEITLRFGTLFEELKDDKGLSSYQFYMIYIFRRLFYVWNLILMRNAPYVQLLFNILISLIVKYI